MRDKVLNGGSEANVPKLADSMSDRMAKAAAFAQDPWGKTFAKYDAHHKNTDLHRDVLAMAPTLRDTDKARLLNHLQMKERSGHATYARTSGDSSHNTRINEMYGALAPKNGNGMSSKQGLTRMQEIQKRATPLTTLADALGASGTGQLNPGRFGGY